MMPPPSTASRCVYSAATHPPARPPAHVPASPLSHDMGRGALCAACPPARDPPSPTHLPHPLMRGEHPKGPHLGAGRQKQRRQRGRRGGVGPAWFE